MVEVNKERKARFFNSFRSLLRMLDVDGLLFLAFYICKEAKTALSKSQQRKGMSSSWAIRQLDEMLMQMGNWNSSDPENMYAKVLHNGEKCDVKSFCHQFAGLLSENYPELIELIIDHLAHVHGRSNGIAATPRELSKLMAILVSRTGAKCVFDPCAGLCGYVVQPEFGDIDFIGNELSEIVRQFANIRLHAHGILSKMIAQRPAFVTEEYLNDAPRHGWVSHEDSTIKWPEVSFDCVASELPFGVRIPNQNKSLEDLTLERIVDTDSVRHAVILVSPYTLYRRYNRDLRRKICDNGMAEAVIGLPSGILSLTGIKSCILVINKDMPTSRVRFISAEDCVSEVSLGKKVLDTNAVLKMLGEPACETSFQQCEVTCDELAEKDYSLLPDTYLKLRVELQRGQVLAKLSDICEVVRGEHNYAETQGPVLDKLYKDLVSFRTSKAKVLEKELNAHRYKKVEEKCVIFNPTLDGMFIKEDDTPIYVPEFHCVLRPLSDKCTMEYLAYSVLQADKRYQTQAIVQGRIYLDDFILPFYPSVESQNEIIRRIYRHGERALRKKLEKLRMLGGRSSDLLHSLGTTFNSISAALASMEKGNCIDLFSNTEDENQKAILQLKAKVDFALRQIDSAGADYKNVKPNLCVADIDSVLYAYTKAWEVFGYHSFRVIYTPLPEGEHLQCKVDADLLYTLLDCIFINAHQHAFEKNLDSENVVNVKVCYVAQGNKEYAMLSISNNGLPMSEGFSLADYSTRGVAGISSEQDGVGGDHICKIAHLHGGKLSLDCDRDWTTVNILLPVWLASDNLTPDDYECESI